MKISIIGLGLIGGSMARDLKSQLNVTVYGVDDSVQHQKLAMELGLVHEILSFDQAIEISTKKKPVCDPIHFNIMRSHSFWML